MRKPVTRAPKPPRRHLILPTLAENITIMRGIAADPARPIADLPLTDEAGVPS